MTRQLILDIAAAPTPSLDNFVEGPNRAALDALRHWQPGRAVYLWGSPGSGRSHLLKALAAAGSGWYFEPGMGSRALKQLSTADTIGHRIVAVDDVHALDEPGQAALFALYNRWREAAASDKAFALILAGDRAPLSMPVREDLRTRLGWDLVFRLELLSDDDRAQALKAQARERGLDLSPDLVAWVLTHYDRDMSRLTALVDALDRYSLERHRAITLPLLKDLLAAGQPTPPAERP